MDINKVLTMVLAAVVGLMITNAFVCLILLEYLMFN